MTSQQIYLKNKDKEIVIFNETYKFDGYYPLNENGDKLSINYFIDETQLVDINYDFPEREIVDLINYSFYIRFHTGIPFFDFNLIIMKDVEHDIKVAAVYENFAFGNVVTKREDGKYFYSSHKNKNIIEFDKKLHKRDLTNIKILDEKDKNQFDAADVVFHEDIAYANIAVFINLHPYISFNPKIDKKNRWDKKNDIELCFYTYHYNINLKNGLIFRIQGRMDNEIITGGPKIALPKRTYTTINVSGQEISAKIVVGGKTDNETIEVTKMNELFDLFNKLSKYGRAFK